MNIKKQEKVSETKIDLRRWDEICYKSSKNRAENFKPIFWGASTKKVKKR